MMLSTKNIQAGLTRIYVLDTPDCWQRTLQNANSSAADPTQLAHGSAGPPDE
jgi:hypothetical protein